MRSQQLIYLITIMDILVNTNTDLTVDIAAEIFMMRRL